MKLFPTKDMYWKIMKVFEVRFCTKAQLHKNEKSNQLKIVEEDK